MVGENIQPIALATSPGHGPRMRLTSADCRNSAVAEADLTADLDDLATKEA